MTPDPPAIVTQLIERISRRWPAEKWQNFPILVAVSGGPDSVAMLRLLAAMTQLHSQIDHSHRLIVAHYNHQLRGAAADRDEQFVRELAQEMGLECRVGHGLNNTVENSEERLRNRRYDWLIETARQTGARYLATGHTADDHVETILFRFLRGTGIGGLAGIPALRVVDETLSIIRPLLETARTEIELVLTELQQEYRVDDSNAETTYTRNYLRQKLLPDLRSRFGENIPESLIRLGRQAAETEAFLEVAATGLWSAVESQTPRRIEIVRARLKDQPDILIRQFCKQIWTRQNWPLQSMSFDTWQSLADLMTGRQCEVGNLPGNVRVEVGSNRVCLQQAEY